MGELIGECGIKVADLARRDVNPIDYIAETLRVILEGHEMNAIAALMRWNFQETLSRLWRRRHPP